MTLKSKLSMAALLAVVATSGLATTSANAGWLFVPENGSTFCDDVRFSCGTTYVPQEYRRQYTPPPRHGGRPGGGQIPHARFGSRVDAEQGPAGVDRVIQTARLEREQQGEVRAGRSDLSRLGGEPPGLSDDRGVPDAAALDQRERSREQRHHERGRDDGEQRAQAARSPLHGTKLVLLGADARLQERTLDG